MKLIVRVEGLSDVQEALTELPKQLQKPAMRRVLTKGAELIRAAAEGFAPRDTGELAGSIVIATGFDSQIGKKEYAKVLKSGGTKRQAVAALRAARRSSASVSIPFLWVGPAAADSQKNAIKRIVQEFGSKFQAPQPYMRPAWDTQREAALQTIANELWPEIEKTAERYRARAERLAAKGK